MRYYVKRDGRLSSITVSEELSQYLLLKLGGSTHDRGGDVPGRGRYGLMRFTTGKGMVQHWINALVESSPDMPTKDVSQWVQAQMLHAIVDPALQQKLDVLKSGVHPTVGIKLM
ncbi:hypothetical protein HBN76_06315 [Pseudomonas sp. WS 5013]|uniref:hypothetical protein n=1 Tax=Pseudomonas sp. WS 5013 TaxID=2717475 RepID=UPI001475C13A|nr:hypothetical protein [Pseudomonas sp. WS 5013]NMY40910.1 hypothetical protein [Pseudomonas sp. WS 5013]